MVIIDKILYIAPPLLQVVLAVTIFKRRLHHTFPMFFRYTVYAVMAAIVRAGSRQNRRLYYESYWLTEAVFALLGLLVLYEVFKQVFRGYLGADWLKIVFPAVSVAALLLAVLRTSTTRISQAYWLSDTILSFEIFVRIMQGACFCILFGMVLFLGLRWRHYAFGIALGYGLYAAVVLAFGLLRYENGTKFNSLFVTASAVAYFMAVLIWVSCFVIGEGAPVGGSPVQPLRAEELTRYKRLLREFLGYR